MMTIFQHIAMANFKEDNDIIFKGRSMDIRI